MKDKIEGTLTLDGLIEGKVHGNGDLEARLQEWTTFMGSVGLRFNLEVSGNTFSILPDAGPFQTASVGGAPDRVIADTLGQLVGLFPPEQRRGIFSTLRSAEIRKGQEVQAVYPVGPDGSIQVQTRVVDAKTIAPESPLPIREKLKMAAIGLVGAAALLGVLSLFLDFPSMIRQVADTVRPLDPADITIQVQAYEDYLTVERVAIDPRDDVLLLGIQRSDRYPTSPAKAARLLREVGPDDLTGRLALEALVRGYVRCELFDREGRFVAVTTLRVRDLEQQASLDLVIPLPRKVRIATLVFAY